MGITNETKEFIDSLVDYYISEADSYRQIAEAYVPEIGSVPDTAFGIITGCIYSGFLQAYQNQEKTPDLVDIQEFNNILKNKAAMIKKAILGDITKEVINDTHKDIHKTNRDLK